MTRSPVVEACWLKYLLETVPALSGYAVGSAVEFEGKVFASQLPDPARSLFASLC
jgi:hypothetical protein